MKKSYYLLFPLFLFLIIETQARPLKRFFKKCDKFLAESVFNGKVNYEGLVKNPSKLEQLVRLIENCSLEGSSKNEKIAFYINAYNVLVISQIVSAYPVRSPFDVEGFYDEFFHEVAGERLSLSQIQEVKLLKKYKDIRISFALCAGTVGSFPLSSSVYKPEKLNKQLDQKIKELANNEKYVRVKRNSSRVLVCEAFIRFKHASDPKDLLSKISEYLKEHIPQEYALDYYPANRHLNITK